MCQRSSGTDQGEEIHKTSPARDTQGRSSRQGRDERTASPEQPGPRKPQQSRSDNELAREAARGSAEMDGLVGVHFYITNQVSSNHLVTDTNGKLVCKYVYEPYGKMNMNLTDTDPDKDGVQFVALKKFTGQEYDYETGLYNYNARLYDQETGRFLQPDPVHSEHVGYDNYDRYQYVHSNPVNFTDPTGETALVTAMLGGLKWAGTSIGNGLRWAGSGMSGGMQWASGGLRRAGDSYSQFLFGKDHNCPSFSSCGLSHVTLEQVLMVAGTAVMLVGAALAAPIVILIGLAIGVVGGLINLIKHGHKVREWWELVSGKDNGEWKPDLTEALAITSTLNGCAASTDSGTCTALAVAGIQHYAHRKKEHRQRQKWGDLHRIGFVRKGRYDGLSLVVRSGVSVFCLQLASLAAGTPPVSASNPGNSAGSPSLLASTVAYSVCTSALNKAVQ